MPLTDAPDVPGHSNKLDEANSHEHVAEAALAALAAPIQWKPNLDSECEPGKEHWVGEYQGVHYYLSSPTTPDDPDKVQCLRLWYVAIDSPTAPPNSAWRAYASTGEAGKALCQRYALTSNDREIGAIGSAMAAQATWYIDSDMKAVIALAGCKRRLLGWHPQESRRRIPLQFAANGYQGRYEVRWDEERRWVVTFRPHQGKRGTRTQERCFITRYVARIACAVYDQTGEWIATLTEIPKFQ